jgi:transaldolase
MTVLYIDSANPRDWQEMVLNKVCTRATCNPLLIRAAQLPISIATATGLVEAANKAGLSQLHLQAWPDDDGNWEPVGLALGRLADYVVVKLPAIPKAMQAASRLRQHGIPVLITAISNPMHALWAQEMGANYVAPYLGRLNEAGREAYALLDNLVHVQEQGGPKVIAASIRDLSMLGRVIASGAYGVTIQKKLLDQAMSDEQSQLAVEQFEQARRQSL